MSEVMVVLCTVPLEKAADLAQIIVKERSAACVNIIRNVESYYWWEGKIDCEREALLIIKTQGILYGKVKQLIEANHPYTVPEIVGVPINSINDSYKAWLIEETNA
jgi:periplasmic divalent cation tolerance protein